MKSFPGHIQVRSSPGLQSRRQGVGDCTLLLLSLRAISSLLGLWSLSFSQLPVLSQPLLTPGPLLIFSWPWLTPSWFNPPSLVTLWVLCLIFQGTGRVLLQVPAVGWEGSCRYLQCVSCWCPLLLASSPQPAFPDPSWHVPGPRYTRQTAPWGYKASPGYCTLGLGLRYSREGAKSSRIITTLA